MSRFLHFFRAVLMLLAILSQIEANSSSDVEFLISHIRKSINDAEKLSSKINNEILQIEGMSSRKVRHFLNNLCSLPHTRYLEIGSWKGSTWVSALFNNQSSIDLSKELIKELMPCSMKYCIEMKSILTAPMMALHGGMGLVYLS